MSDNSFDSDLVELLGSFDMSVAPLSVGSDDIDISDVGPVDVAFKVVVVSSSIKN